ncbi:MAG: glycosyltransferase family 2 protein, partial [Candidatus Roizmanbacteria bacterium]|nr:glycosyltransferase family 2 protein [Candidatus Roizmanbacteria bacterium]
MNIVFLMAGRGSRFKEVGYDMPKALIELHGKPMFVWAVESLSFIRNAQYYFLILKEHEQNGLSDEIKKRYGKKAHVVILDRVTHGAAETALSVKEYIDTDEELIISNADHFFRSHELEEELSKKQHDFSGIIPVFEATHPRWSFAKVNGNGMITEVAEKVPISNNATVGVYYFKHGKDFVWAAEEMIQKDIRRNNEFYICPVYNELIGRGDKIKAV